MKSSRPPVVVVLGHVDHGKTSLLDAIRNTSVAKREAGGITQSIGASVVTLKDGKTITFVDTPGHAAFSKMRSRGAKVADIAVLVVAADDGVRPQTKEAIEAINVAQIPFLIAFTKIDLPSADIEKAKGSLEQLGVYLEGRGGDIVTVEVSSKNGTGIVQLLEMITLISEMNNISGDPKAPLEAVVVETTKDRLGLLVSTVVRNGTIEVGDKIFAGEIEGKARGLFDANGKSQKSFGPGYPCQILGFDQAPYVGSIVSYEVSKHEVVDAVVKKTGLNEGIPILLKSSNAGSMEAILASIPEGILVTDSSVGDVTETDIFLAKASHARVIVFEAKVSSSVVKLAEAEGVNIETYKIIYEMLDALEKLVKDGALIITGKAEVIAEFPFNNKRVAGCKLVAGLVNKKTVYKLMRGEQLLGEVKVHSIKKQRHEVDTVVVPGEEFGVLFEPQLDFKKGDVLVSVKS